MASKSDSAPLDKDCWTTKSAHAVQFDRFRFIASLGFGTMGSVCLAEDTRLGRRVAIKSFSRELSRDPEFYKRIEQECHAHAKVGTHTHIVTLYDCVECDEQIHLVMEYVDGKSLQELLDRNGGDGVAFPVGQVLDIGHQCLEALSRVHSRGIVHRDVNPSNILIAETEPGGVSAKLMGFSVARLLDDEQLARLSTTDGSGPGTPPYMAPEQIESDRFGKVTPATDVYAMGALLYELLAGASPFSGTLTEVLDAIVNTPAPRLDAVVPSRVPPILADVLEKSLAKRPEDRYGSAREFQVELLRARIRLMRPEVDSGQWVVPQLLDMSDSNLSQWFAETDQRARTKGTPRRGWMGAAIAAGILIAVGLAVTVLATWFWQDSRDGAGALSELVESESLQVQDAHPSPAIPPAFPADRLAAVETEPAAPEPVVISRSVGPAPSWYLQLARFDWRGSMEEVVMAPDVLVVEGVREPAPVQPASATNSADVDEGSTGHRDKVARSLSLPDAREYVVQSGDSLIRIANRFGLAVRDLQWWNGIRIPDSIFVGQTIKLYPSPDLPPQDRFFAQLAKASSQPAPAVKAPEIPSEQAPPLVADTEPPPEPVTDAPAETKNPVKKFWRKLRGKD